MYGSDIEYVTLGEWRVKSFLDIPSIKETKYLSNGDYNKRTLIDFDGTLPDGTPYSTASLTSIIDGNLGGETISIVDPDGSGYAMKIVTSIDIDPWQGSTHTLHNGDIDLTTDNKVVNVMAFVCSIHIRNEPFQIDEQKLILLLKQKMLLEYYILLILYL